LVGRKGSLIREWLEEDSSFQKFNVLVQRNKLMPSTALNYGKYVKRFCDFLKADSPEQALEKVKEVSPEERVDLVDDFVQYLLNNEMNSSTVLQLVRGGLKKWLLLNEVEVDWKKVQREILPGEELIVSDRKPSKEELRQILRVGGLRDSVMILVLASSGLRVGTLASLSLGEIDLTKSPSPITVKRKPGRKVSRKLQKYVTFISSEAKKVLLQYLEHRRQLGETITDSSPILTSDRKQELGNFLNSMYVSNHWRRLLKRAHLATKNGGPWHDIHLHTLRKFFETECINANVKTAYREHWMGHTGVHLESSYFRGGEESHVEEYRKAIPYLNILTPQTEDYMGLIEKVKFLEENGKRKEMEIEKLRAQAEENIDLKNRQRKTEDDLDKIITRLEKQDSELGELKKLIRERTNQT
jgi:integrase